MTLQCCVNGSRQDDEHEAVARTAAECAAEAAAAVAAGADDLHVHPRTSDGRDSLARRDVAAWVSAVRDVVGAVPVGVTTGAWAWAGGVDAARAVGAWDVLPDHASVNWHEPGAPALAQALTERGVALHAGVWTVDDAQAWLDSPWCASTARVLLEVADAPDQLDAARRMLDLVLPAGVPVLLHGEGQSAWPVLDLAVEVGVPTRIGLEDVLEGPDGEHVDGNADLVRAAVARGAGDLRGPR